MFKYKNFKIKMTTKKLSEILNGSCVFSLFWSKRPSQNFAWNLSDFEWIN